MSVVLLVALLDSNNVVSVRWYIYLLFFVLGLEVERA